MNWRMLTICVVMVQTSWGQTTERPNAFELTQAKIDGQTVSIRTREQWKPRRANIVQAMESVMGSLPIREPSDLKMSVIQETDLGRYVLQLITYEADANVKTPAYLCIPKNVLAGERKAKAVLCLHPTDNQVGHQVVVGLGGKPGRQYAAELANVGFVAISPAYPHLANYWPNLGKLGYQSGTMKAIWDNIRALDLLAELDYVDASQGFGCIGHSLGGHNGLFTSVFDKRIQVVVSSCGFDSFQDYYDGNIKNWYFGKGWCQIRYMPKMSDYRGRTDEIPFDFPEILAAIAPRHVFISAPKLDSNFRWKSVQKCVNAAQPIFELFQCKQNLKVEFPDADHNFPAAVRQQSYQLINRVLSKKPG